MTEEYKIDWVKWEDPWEVDNTKEDEKGYDDDPDHKVVPPQNFYYSHTGLVPLNEATLPSKNYNFWVGHTNFRLSDWHCEIIDEIPGVEFLRILSGYRIWVCVAKLFDEKAVKKQIEIKMAETKPRREEFLIIKENGLSRCVTGTKEELKKTLEKMKSEDVLEYSWRKK